MTGKICSVLTWETLPDIIKDVIPAKAGIQFALWSNVDQAHKIKMDSRFRENDGTY